MKRPGVPRGLYVITPDGFLDTGSAAEARLDEVLARGVRMLQYRDKAATGEQRRDRAARLLRVCRRNKVPLIINDNAALAAAIGADGVHVGARDGADEVSAARARLGRIAIVGASCGGSMSRAREAVSAGADYVAFGRFFASRTKPDAPAATLEVLREAATALPVPACAIGGITPDNVHEVLARGAELVAVVAAVLGSEDPAAAVDRFRDVIE